MQVVTTSFDFKVGNLFLEVFDVVYVYLNDVDYAPIVYDHVLMKDIGIVDC